jgi:hypothetical protein
MSIRGGCRNDDVHEHGFYWWSTRLGLGPASTPSSLRAVGKAVRFAERQVVVPRSPMGAALHYTLNPWDALNRYVEQGYPNIDNNAAERALRRVAIGGRTGCSVSVRPTAPTNRWLDRAQRKSLQ